MSYVLGSFLALIFCVVMAFYTGEIIVAKSNDSICMKVVK
jgi:hypothetical protein